MEQDGKPSVGETVTQSLSELKALRSSTKGSMTRIRQVINEKRDSLSLPELECRLGILESYFKQILSTQIQIERLSGGDEVDKNSKARADIEDLYIETKSSILSLISKLKAILSPDALNASIVPSQTVSRSNLQCQKIPKFSGKYSEYPNFIGIFKKLVHNNLSLDNLERFNYLIDSLEGPALAAVKEFEVSELNYTKAFSRLKERFDNKNLMLQEHIKSLFGLSKVSKGSSSQLRSLVDAVNNHFNAMQTIGSLEKIANALIIYIVCEKLDTESLIKWEESIDYSKLNTWHQCEEVLSRRCQNLEVRESKLSTPPSSSQMAQQNQSAPRRNRARYSGSNNNTSLVVSGINCQYCNKSGHSIELCSSFKNLNVIARFTEVKKRMLCINCLGSGHVVKKCTVTKCQVCGWPHHLLLHRYGNSSREEDSLRAEPEAVNPVNSSLHSSTMEIGQERDSAQVILATAVIRMQDSHGQFHDVRALLDSASQLNFVTEAVVQRLHLRKTRADTTIAGVGKKPLDVKYSTNIAIQSRVAAFDTSVEALILPKITGVHPEKAVDTETWNIPRNLQLADPNFNLPSAVDLLIGADLFYNLLSVGQIKLGDECPTLQKTVFGWVVSGKTKTARSRNTHCHMVAECRNVDSALDELVERFWHIETIHPNMVPLTEEESSCETHFQSTMRRDKEGRFVVKLPFKANRNELGESLHSAERRFFSLEKRLLRNPELKCQYAEFVQEYMDMGHMIKVPRCNQSRVRYFTPHQCVMKPDSTTTKLRVVFDCSSRTSTNLSLNDVLMKGPVVQDELFSIVMRFRCYQFALTADISKMYRQILVDDRDTFYQCILWRDDPDKDLEIYRLLTVTYGTTSAPYLATRCLKALAEEHENSYPIGAAKIREDFYIDDLITGADTIEEIDRIYNEVRALLSQGKFDIRKWYSNESNFLQKIPKGDREKPLRINDADIIKALGIVWDPKSDELCCMDPKIVTSTRVTMRSVLSEMSQLFDPLGLISPIIVRAKIFMQDLWISKVKWDESLSQDLHTQWNSFKTQLADLNKIRIERCVIPTGNFEIHGFADASGRAYGCCIYIRYKVDGKFVVRLFSAKSRVAPRKVQPIPRLELCAAELLVLLLEKVLKNVPNRIEAIYLWTDSEIVLYWLAKHPSTWEIFVANRVSRIQQGSHQATWRHVGSKSNPADIVSRGATVADLLNSFWFKGPAFLYKEQEHWPNIKPVLKQEDVPEKRNVQISLLSVEIQQEFFNRYTKFSNLQKTLRIISYVRRYIDGYRQRRAPVTGPFTSKELDETFLRLVWNIQQSTYAEEIKVLQSNKELSKQSTLKALAPFLELHGDIQLLRVGGRLQNAKLPFEAKHPLLLPKNNLFVRQYMVHLHRKNFHAGPQALLAIARQNVWIVNCRNLASSIVKQCVLCFKYRPRLLYEVMGSLPKNRVELIKPFLVAGVDFCGPQYITEGVRGRPPKKVYVAVFVCFGCKAVHLEVVGDLTSKSFIAALKRFVARRGLPQRIYCDNATNFVGARRELEDLKGAFMQQQIRGDIQSWCSAEGIEFRHIPPRAPHFGGLWEAAVKSFKHHFRRVSSNNIFSFEELTTFVIEIESVLNSRPISSMSSDPNDYEALTPGHFLIGSPQRAVPEPLLEEPKSMSAIERWKRLSVLRQHFWERWQKDYLLDLQNKAKWREAARKELKQDTLVLIQEDNTPSNQWLIGRVVATIKGGDSKVRVVDVRTKNGVIRRAIHRLAVLPIDT